MVKLSVLYFPSRQTTPNRKGSSGRDASAAPDSGGGQITDSLGQKTDFRNTIVIMTSNVGAELIKRQTALGFGAVAGHESHEAMRDKILGESKRVFKHSTHLKGSLHRSSLTHGDSVPFFSRTTGGKEKALPVHHKLEEVLDEEWENTFRRWYAAFRSEGRQVKKAA
jgi:hypothetical protein